jgi:hypothetical protein
MAPIGEAGEAVEAGPGEAGEDARTRGRESTREGRV